MELSLRPTRVTEQPVVLLGMSVLAGAKALLIRFIARLLRFLQDGTWCLMGGVRLATLAPEATTCAQIFRTLIASKSPSALQTWTTLSSQASIASLFGLVVQGLRN